MADLTHEAIATLRAERDEARRFGEEAARHYRAAAEALERAGVIGFRNIAEGIDCLARHRNSYCAHADRLAKRVGELAAAPQGSPAELERLRAENAELKARLEQQAQQRFGRRSERRRRRQPDEKRPPPRRDEHGRSPLPAHLERRTVVHDLTEAEKLCPCCGRPRVGIGEQATEQLDLEPARFFVLRTVKKSYACRHCDPAAVPAAGVQPNSA